MQKNIVVLCLSLNIKRPHFIKNRISLFYVSHLNSVTIYIYFCPLKYFYRLFYIRKNKSLYLLEDILLCN